MLGPCVWHVSSVPLQCSLFWCNPASPSCLVPDKRLQRIGIDEQIFKGTERQALNLFFCLPILWLSWSNLPDSSCLDTQLKHSYNMARPFSLSFLKRVEILGVAAWSKTLKSGILCFHPKHRSSEKGWAVESPVLAEVDDYDCRLQDFSVLAKAMSQSDYMRFQWIKFLSFGIHVIRNS